VVFAQSVEHSKVLVSAFEEAGVIARHVDGSTPRVKRERILCALGNGGVTLVSSVGVLSEGFDEPSVSCVMLLRATQSKALYVQQVGRGLRQSDGKADCVVIDQSGNTARHGPVSRSMLKKGEIGSWRVHRVSESPSEAGAAQRLHCTPQDSVVGTETAAKAKAKAAEGCQLAHAGATVATSSTKPDGITSGIGMGVSAELCTDKG